MLVAAPLAPHRPAERLGSHLLLAVALALVPLAIVLIAVATTRRRARRTAAAAPALELPRPPEPMPVALATPMAGVALGTTAPAGWQDLAVQGVLGSRRGGELIVTCAGVALGPLWLPRAMLRSVRVSERFATKVMPGTGLLVIGWECGGQAYESGFRGAASGYGEVVDAVRGLLPADEDAIDVKAVHSASVPIVKGVRA